MEDFLLRHEIKCACQAKDLTSLIKSTFGESSPADLRASRTMGLATLKLGRDFSNPLFRPMPDGYYYSYLGLAKSAIQQGLEVVRHLYEPGVMRGPSAETAEGKPAALLALDFPTDGSGRPCTQEDPLINAVLLAPLSLPLSFGSASQAEAFVSRFDIGPTPLRSIKWHETDSSEVGIRLAVDHLQRFVRTLEGATFPEDARPVFVVGDHGGRLAVRPFGA